jgi:hypothetical protein
MNNYYYSQRYSGYGNKSIVPGLTMAVAGCFITDYAMILSYFNDRPFYPDQMLDFLKRKHYIQPTGRTEYRGLEDAAGFKLRFSYSNNPKPGEMVFTIRQVYFGKAPDWHWVIDSPTRIGMIIDPWDGRVKNYSDFKYTGQHRYFIGKI